MESLPDIDKLKTLERLRGFLGHLSPISLTIGLGTGALAQIACQYAELVGLPPIDCASSNIYLFMLGSSIGSLAWKVLERILSPLVGFGSFVTSIFKLCALVISLNKLKNDISPGQRSAMINEQIRIIFIGEKKP